MNRDNKEGRFQGSQCQTAKGKEEEKGVRQSAHVTYAWEKKMEAERNSGLGSGKASGKPGSCRRK